MKKELFYKLFQGPQNDNFSLQASHQYSSMNK
jgi:hypothetical protein